MNFKELSDCDAIFLFACIQHNNKRNVNTCTHIGKLTIQVYTIIILLIMITISLMSMNDIRLSKSNSKTTINDAKFTCQVRFIVEL